MLTNQEWYHPTCIGLTEGYCESVRLLGGWECGMCCTAVPTGNNKSIDDETKTSENTNLNSDCKRERRKRVKEEHKEKEEKEETPPAKKRDRTKRRSETTRTTREAKQLREILKKLETEEEDSWKRRKGEQEKTARSERYKRRSGDLYFVPPFENEEEVVVVEEQEAINLSAAKTRRRGARELEKDHLIENNGKEKKKNEETDTDIGKKESQHLNSEASSEHKDSMINLDKGGEPLFHRKKKWKEEWEKSGSGGEGDESKEANGRGTVPIHMKEIQESDSKREEKNEQSFDGAKPQTAMQPKEGKRKGARNQQSQNSLSKISSLCLCVFVEKSSERLREIDNETGLSNAFWGGGE